MNTINPEELQKWLSNDEAILIDVREPAEFSTSHIEGASLLPLGKISVTDLPNTDKKMVIYCQKGMRGHSACKKLTEQDSNIVLYNLAGGISAWQESGNKIINGTSKTLPLDRQVQLTIGTLALSGSIAGYLLEPSFMLIPAFLGAGLIFAGLSGTCGLAVLLAKMPWNQKG